MLFGAGHVGQALATILSGLPCRVKWFDSREEFASRARGFAGTNTEVISMENPDLVIDQCPAHAWYLVMTHSHELDMQLIESILARKDIEFCGLIGSRSKGAKFRNRLKRRQYTDQEIGRLTSPIGLDQVGGKRPMEVAVSVAAQLISLRQQLSRESDCTLDCEGETANVVDFLKR
jgi:xanthine dehydrogenase accessory factor